MSILASCATVVSPSGGPKDVQPPQVVESAPENFSINFASKKIEITFDEFVKLQKIGVNLIISPPLEERPTFMVKGKSLIIKLEEELLPSTTYNFNLGNSIVDITENNAIPNFQYVFSTGTYIDSLQVSGKVEDEFERKPEDKVIVILYKCDELENCDSLPYNSKPRYFTRTDATGTFTIKTIKHGRYKMTALVDKNQNFVFDLPNERVGFISELIDPAPAYRSLTTFGKGRDSIRYEMRMFSEKKELKIIRARGDKPGRIDFVFNLPVRELKVQPLNFSSKKAWEVVTISANGDSATYWNNYGVDSLELWITDSYYDFDDTVEVACNNKTDEMPLTFSSNLAGYYSFDYYKNLELTASQPIVQHNFDKIFLLQKMDSVNYDTLTPEIIFEDPELLKIEIRYNWQQQVNYKLIIDKKAFRDIYRNTNDSILLEFKTRAETYYGNAKLDLVFPSVKHQYIIQLLNANKGVVSETIVTPKDKMREGLKKLKYDYLNPGKYSIRVIYDSNNDGMWTSGDLINGIQPENVTYYPDPITIRSNWDVVLEWDLKE